MDAHVSNSPVQIGEIVAGKYRVERRIGRGGVGVVVAAHHLALDEPVALKFIRPNLTADREVVQRMLREARATFRLRSEHTVRVLDADELPSGAVYIVMELLHGNDLRAEVAARGPLPEAEVVAYVLQACEALEEAHALGIVHRDLKPHNLFLAKQRRGPPIVKVLDFGMSKVDPAFFEAAPLTQPEFTVGTPRYMAPEQWKSAATVDHRADIWALGIVMYELLTGKVPLHDLPLEERQARLLAGAIPSARDLRAEISEETSRIVGRCLKGDPMGRWRSVGQLAAALREAHPDPGGQDAPADMTQSQSIVTTMVPTDDMLAQAGGALAVPTSEPAPTTDRVDDDVTVIRATALAEAAAEPTAEPFSAKPPASGGTLRSEAPLVGPNEPVGEALAPSTGPNEPVGQPWTQATDTGPKAPLLAAPTEATLRLPGAPPHPSMLHARAGAAPPAAPAVAPLRPMIHGPANAPATKAQQSPTSTIAMGVAIALAAIAAGALAAWLIRG